MKEDTICEACLSSSFGKTHTAVDGCLLKPLNMWGRDAEAHAKDSKEPVQSSAASTASRELGRGESEELDDIMAKLDDGIALGTKRSFEGEDFDFNIPLESTRTALLQWRTKSLLALLPGERSTINLPSGGGNFNDGYNAALQDIRKGIEG